MIINYRDQVLKGRCEFFEKFKRRTGIHCVERHGEAVRSDAKTSENFNGYFKHKSRKDCLNKREVQAKCDADVQQHGCHFPIFVIGSMKFSLLL
ncbi:hypothetical protein NPIL_56721 [Nephila pilipes]|uniref:Uncharacterized protein n=1 Tax=Nephila pilipes TaxID=299642 RepID=A0A8X6Q0E2_NEPPI|nr:hypothetical protein NPIL_691391 [Nephila pilipes]GFU33269.1 hypothetical protein NPIL_56721 [Nephila pilipes]